MDGTIADTIPMCIKAFRNSVSPYTDHELSREEILHTFGLNEIGMVKAVVGRNRESVIEDFYYQYELLYNEVTSVFPGILKQLVTATLVTRAAGAGELDTEQAYHLSDLYIRECENTQDIDALHSLTYTMVVDFATRTGSRKLRAGRN